MNYANAYRNLDDDCFDMTFEKFSYKPKQKSGGKKQTKQDQINAKRRERESEREQMLANKDMPIIG